MTNPEQREKIARAIAAFNGCGEWEQMSEVERDCYLSVAGAIIALDPAPESAMVDQFTGDEGIAAEHARALAQPNPLDTPRPAPDVEESVRHTIEQGLRLASKSPPGFRIRILSAAMRDALNTLARSSGS